MSRPRNRPTNEVESGRGPITGPLRFWLVTAIVLLVLIVLLSLLTATSPVCWEFS